ncbi:TadE-like protein [Rubripirellula obstinata]|uniref:TadE-like protein n=1 Tax=Rubripirellula obstinata TaxID=406547 RepID=A0A5B1CF25_9BACT|nr:TadE family protein [Rubripirellula obstinata]KAA1258821.1 TadE-like protein [Rubripirellula obstinata]
MNPCKFSLQQRRRRQNKNRGAATVEFAISITILILFLFASVEFARLSLVNHAVKHSSYLAARRAMIVGANASDAEDAAINHLNAMGVSSGNVTVNPAVINDETEIVTVTVSVPVAGNSWISPAYFGGDMTGRTRMLAERSAGKMASTVETAIAP